MERGKSTVRYSKKREAIFNALQETKIHPTAEWLFQKLKPEYPDLSLGTIYRNLSFFQEQGMVKSVGVVKGQERYDADTTTHSHFICEKCGSVTDLMDISLTKSIAQQVEKNYGFSVSRHELNIYGDCGCGNIKN